MAHPLSPDEGDALNRRFRGSEAVTTRPVTNYFDLKRESDARAAELSSNDNSFYADEEDPGSVTPRWPAPPENHANGYLSAPPAVRRRPSAVIGSNAPVVGKDRNANSSLDESNSSSSSSSPTPTPPVDIAGTPWHTLDDTSINAVLTSSNALRDALRVVSKALDDSTSRYNELQAIRQKESGFEDRARQNNRI